MNDITIVNAKYKLFKNEKHNGVIKVDLKGVPFVGCGVDIGEVFGVANKLSSINRSSNESVISPFILFCETLSQGKAMFENLKKEKIRFNKLAGEIQKQKIIDKARATELLNQTMENSNLSNQNSQTKDMGKRLALNNGIFKPNENY